LGGKKVFFTEETVVRIEEENTLDTFLVLGVDVSKKAIENRFGRRWDQVAYLADQYTMAVQSWLASRSSHAEQFKNEGTVETLPVCMWGKSVMVRLRE
jgi:hypothetical protein